MTIITIIDINILAFLIAAVFYTIAALITRNAKLFVVALTCALLGLASVIFKYALFKGSIFLAFLSVFIILLGIIVMIFIIISDIYKSRKVKRH